MVCQLYQKQLSLYVDGELAAARTARLEAHLRVCPHCRGELNAMIGIADHLRAASRHLRVSQDFDQRVLRAVGYWQVTGRRTARPWRRALIVAAMAVLALLGALWHFLFQPPARTPAPQPGAAQVTPVSPAVPVPVPQEGR